MKQKKGRTVWLARHNLGSDSAYAMFDIKPTISLYINGAWGVSKSKSYTSGFCPDEFHRITGLHLEPGECVRVRINIEPVGKVITGKS